MIHVIGDILQSVGVLVAAVLLYFFGDTETWTPWQYADPLCTYLFSILVLFTTFGVAKECVKVLMEATPTGKNQLYLSIKCGRVRKSNRSYQTSQRNTRHPHLGSLSW